MPQPDLWHTTFKLTCPKCGQGKLYKNFLVFKDKCDVCRFDISEHDNGDGPAVFIIFITGFLTVGLAIGFEIYFTPPLWLHMVIWPIFITLISLILLRYAKALVIALQVKFVDTDENDSTK